MNMLRLVFIFLLVLSTSCDGNNSNGANADFPGNCICGARFTLNNELITVCSSDEYCRCVVNSDSTEMYCYIKPEDEGVVFDHFSMDYVGTGVSQDRLDSMSSTVRATVSDETYLASDFEVTFINWGGVGDTALGTFTAQVSLDDINEYEITDGQFYAPIVSE